jgi:transposase-like protein
MAGFLGLDELFEGRHFDREIIVLCVRWYLRFKLSYRDLVEMMAERGLSLVHVWTAPRMQEENENFDGRVDCDHVSGLLDAAR